MIQETSLEAYRQSKPVSRRAEVIGWLREYPKSGLTIDQLAVLMGVTPNMVSPYTNALMKSGVIVDSRRRRPTRFKRNAIVWVFA